MLLFADGFLLSPSASAVASTSAHMDASVRCVCVRCVLRCASHALCVAWLWRDAAAGIECCDRPLVDDDESVRSDAWRGVRVRDAVDVHRVVGGTSELPGTT
jgi:hypothetical protein